MSSKNVDQNLLFGFLALQNNFVSREELIAAVSGWLVDKSRPLVEIFGERGALSDSQRHLVAALAEEHLKQQGGDVEKSLATLWSVGPLREELKKLGDAEVEASLAHVGNMETIDPMATLPPEAGAMEKVRFRILRPHAEGGLGQVFVARDEELNREVALKEIKHNYARDAESRSRFVLEAEITGGLEHPGIVPVYGAGQYSDGRPFYAMRFIRGVNLAEAVKRFHATTGGKLGGRAGSDAKKAASGQAGSGTEQAAGAQRVGSFESVEFRQLLGRFVDVCNAIEYAHSRGVLHRDLKPGNIMLGKYGETLVVDWGLAKTQGKAEQHQESEEQTLQPRSAGDSAATQMGMAKGTPEYMSPEQAAGRVDELGPASDVYALGATLYCVLTGRAPFDRQGGIGALLLRVQSGEFVAPRAIHGKIPRALEAICLKAMRLQPSERYETPETLADEIERYLADQPVRAYREPMLARGRRWVRKHSVAAGATAATLLAGMLFLAMLAIVVGQANQQLDRANGELGAVNNKLEETNVRLTASKEATDKANAELNRANTRLEETNVRLISTNQSLDKANTELNVANEKLQEAVNTAQEQNKLALDTINYVVFEVDTELGKVPGAGEVRRSLLEGILERVQQVSDKYQSRSSIDRHSAATLLALAELILRIGAAPAGEGEADKAGTPRGATASAREMLARAAEILLGIADANPADRQPQRDLSISYNKLGDIAVQGGDLAAARKFYEQGLEIRERLASADPGDSQAQRDLSISYNKLGDIAVRGGDLAGARKFYKQGLEISQRLASAEPGDSQAQRDLSISFERLGDIATQDGDLAAGRKYYEQGLEISQRLASADPRDNGAQRDLSMSYNKLGDIVVRGGDLTAARKLYEQGLEISQRLASADPRDSQAQRDLSISYNKLGQIAVQEGDLAAARKFYEQGLEISQRLASADPRDTQAQRDLSISLERLGDIAAQEGDLAAARRFYEQCLEIGQRLASADARNSRAQRDLSIGYNKLGDIAVQEGDLAGARKCYEQGLEIRQRLASADPDDSRAQRDLFVSFCKVGLVFQKEKEWTKAMEWFERGKSIVIEFRERKRLNVFQDELELTEKLIRECRAELGK